MESSDPTAGLICIRPMALLGKTAPGLKPDSTVITTAAHENLMPVIQFFGLEMACAVGIDIAVDVRTRTADRAH